jgi:hypothetical protein
MCHGLNVNNNTIWLIALICNQYSIIDIRINCTIKKGQSESTYKNACAKIDKIKPDTLVTIGKQESQRYGMTYLLAIKLVLE